MLVTVYFGTRGGTNRDEIADISSEQIQEIKNLGGFINIHQITPYNFDQIRKIIKAEVGV